MTTPNLKAFVYAVRNHYWYQAYMDDLPMWALVGDFGDGHRDDEEEQGKDKYIWTHKRFDIGVNGKQIVDVNLTTSRRVKLEAGAKVDFSYEVGVSSFNL